MCLHLPLPQLHEVSTPRSCRKRRAADVGNRDSVLKSKACLVRRFPQRRLASFFFSRLDRWKRSLPAYFNPTNNSGRESWIVESCSVNFISHHGRVFGTGCMHANMVPLNSKEGWQWEEGVLRSCSRPAVKLLLCATLSCKLHSLSTLSHSLAYFPLWSLIMPELYLFKFSMFAPFFPLSLSFSSG